MGQVWLPEFGAEILEPDYLWNGRAVLVFLGVALASYLVRRRREAVAHLRAFIGAPSSPVNLAVFRMAVFATTAWKFDLARSVYFAGLPRELMFPPFGCAWALNVTPVNPTLVWCAGLAFYVVLFLGFVGLWTRWACWGAVVFGVYAMGIPQLFGKVNHINHLIWFLALLGASDCGATLSVDGLWREWRRTGRLAMPVPGTSAVYGTPIRSAWILFGLIYFFPGVWKLWFGGLGWCFSENLRNLMLNYEYSGVHFAPDWFLSNHPLQCAAAAGTVIFEIGFIWAILCVRTRPIAIASALAFHFGAGIGMGIWFSQLIGCLPVFFDWEKPVRGALKRMHVPVAANQMSVTRSTGMSFTVVACVLISGASFTGAMGIVVGWPFASYPTFVPMPRASIERVEICVVGADGVEAAMDADEIISRIGRPRYAYMMNRVMRVRDNEVRSTRLRAWCGVLLRDEAARAATTTIRVYRELHSTLPGERERNPVNRELLAEFDLESTGARM